MTIWTAPERISDTMSKARASMSRKNKMTGEYEDDFSGIVNFCGTAAVQKASGLQPRDRIKLGDIDVTRKYDKAASKEYINYKIWSFELADSSNNNASHANETASNTSSSDPINSATDGENPADDSEDGLPF